VTETIVDNGLTRPAGYGDKPLPKRNGPKGLLPSTWLQRVCKVEYVDARGAGVSTSGLVLDTFPTGIVVAIDGAKTLVSWDAVKLIELQND
jgi:hypothetical protein